MKHILTILFATSLLVSRASAQPFEYEGLDYVRRVENRYTKTYLKTNPKTKEKTVTGVENTSSKDKQQIILFGWSNSAIEFFIEPSEESNVGLRIIRDSSDVSYLLEVKWIVNFLEAYELSRDDSHFGTVKIPISDEFFDKIYESVHGAIGTFKPAEPNEILKETFDGMQYTFRCIVGDELWMLRIYEPEGYYGKLSWIFSRMIDDARKGQFHPAKYLEEIDGLSSRN